MCEPTGFSGEGVLDWRQVAFGWDQNFDEYDMVIVLVLLVVAALIAVFVLKKSRSSEGTASHRNASGQGAGSRTEPAAPRASGSAAGVAAPSAVAGAQAAARATGPSARAADENSPASNIRPAAQAHAAGVEAAPPEVTPAEDSAPDAGPVEEISSPAAALDEEDFEVAPPPPPHRTPKPARAASKEELLSMRRGLGKARGSEGFFGKLRALLGGKREIPPNIVEDIEEILLTSDVGVATTETILAGLKDQLSRGDLSDEGKVWDALRAEALRIVTPAGVSGGLKSSGRPTVVLFVGVNGAGKTTTIGKMAKRLTAEGKKVMLAAGDTFRAAAVDQLKAWGERTGVPVVSGKDGADPSAVLFDAIQAAKNAGVDYLLADTAGRLHTKTNLMQEMTKVVRTAGKALEGAPHETLLVVDSTNGQNALAQAKEFKEALGLTGLVLTKLDGTARGGVVLGICGSLGLPIRYVGLGEKAEDLHEFSPADFVEALLGSDGDEIAA